MDAIGRSLMILGVVFVAVGFLLWASPQIPFRSFPDDVAELDRPCAAH